MKRLLATLSKDPEAVLSLGRRRLDLSALPTHTLEWLACRAVPLLVEVDVEDGVGAELRVVRVGNVQPHPRVTALRAVEDGREGLALEALADLGDAVEDDAELVRVLALAAGRSVSGPARIS